MNPTILGVIGPGFLNQVPTLEFKPSRTRTNQTKAHGSRSVPGRWPRFYDVFCPATLLDLRVL